ncbi:hypothetical protein, partial [Pseudomonas lopnurensis]|uniref:hypothetical protein n=1 Tax=Pseudomonas lopnurensis TaxID=1477517 RepID=UPI0028AD3F73
MTAAHDGPMKARESQPAGDRRFDRMAQTKLIQPSQGCWPSQKVRPSFASVENASRFSTLRPAASCKLQAASCKLQAASC